MVFVALHTSCKSHRKLCINLAKKLRRFDSSQHLINIWKNLIQKTQAQKVSKGPVYTLDVGASAKNNPWETETSEK